MDESTVTFYNSTFDDIETLNEEISNLETILNESITNNEENQNPEESFSKKDDEEDEDKEKDTNDDKDEEDEDEEDKKKKKEYSVLETEYAELQEKYSALEVQYQELVNFKTEIDNEKKDALINQFYMLSDEDKKDVIENKSNYSLEDIEAKLSILCVRNKVSFDLDKDSDQDKGPTTYNLDGGEDDNIPAWVKRAMSVAKSLNN